MRVFVLFIIMCFVYNIFCKDEEVVKRKITVVRQLKQVEGEVDPKAFVKRLNKMDDVPFKEAFIKLPTKAKLYYLQKIGPMEYEAYLKRFENEAEWASFWNKLSNEDKRHMPRTLRSQQVLLRDAYCEEVLPRQSLFECWTCPGSQEKPTDIQYWRTRYYASINKFDFDERNDPSDYGVSLKEKLKNKIIVHYAIYKSFTDSK